jgi:hypothetical protein
MILRTEGVAQVVVYLPSKQKTPSSNPDTIKKEKENKKIKGFTLSHLSDKLDHM